MAIIIDVNVVHAKPRPDVHDARCASAARLSQVAAVFLDLCDWVGKNGTFAVFAGLSALCVLGFVRYVPETRGMSLEKTIYLFDDPYPQATCWPARIKDTAECKGEKSKLLATKPV